jgi:branched-chain amino acid transport system substrate-binding protein
VEFQALLTQIASEKPDAVYVFFAGGGAVKFVKDYVAAGLNKTIPLYGAGFLTDGTLEAQGAAAQGLYTTLHYADKLNTPKDNAFRQAFMAAYKSDGDVYAVQGYDFSGKRDAMLKAMHTATIDSPRGKFTLSAANNPVQDIYLRQVAGTDNVVKGVAIKGLADPARGCRPF